jgi:hypothetical protein
MSSKSHRAKVLAAQLEAGPSTSAGELVPPPSLVKPKVKKSKSAKEAVLGTSKGKGKALAIVPTIDEVREPFGVQDEEAIQTSNDVEMGQETMIPTGVVEDDIIEDDTEMLIDPSSIDMVDPSGSTAAKPPTTSSDFLPISQTAQNKVLLKAEERRVAVPAHRMAPLKKEWVNIYGPLVEMMGLMVRMNVRKRCVEMKVSLDLACRICFERSCWSQIQQSIRKPFWWPTIRRACY